MKVFWKRAEKGKPAYFPSVFELSNDTLSSIDVYAYHVILCTWSCYENRL